ncbi:MULTISPECIES: hypothetical protein [unclassified Microbacterium]|uniref:hypothetical protein n=1 Tax=unclassified Microbacterium TaxID=2609290 RepID=UPI001781084E|nr:MULTISPECIES: hypothetical protein [unclassified Microbacterium]MBD8218228.1 hypothetical protein [Microbacterium sp. CFBP 13617]MBD8477586.1 hypothetical protein [Microbacterium sp. CFBP 8794]
MTIPLDAIDPEAGYRQWVEQYLWHVDQLPNVVQAVGTVAMAPQRLRAAQLRERVSGGGFIDNMPVVDGPESRNAAAVWQALRAYLSVAASRLGVEAPALPPSLPDEPDLARQWAFAANEWMAAWVEHILSWPDLAEKEGELFRLIRRARTRLDTGTVRRARPAVCELCGEAGVTVDWEEGPDGPVLLRSCQVCHHRPGGDA